MEDHQAYYADKTVLITGGAGAIGSNLARAAGALARQVVLLDDLSAGYEWNVPSLPNLLFIQGSVTDETALKRVFCLKPRVVFHLAAFFANQRSVDYPQRDLATNGLGTLLVHQYCHLAGVDRLVYASSGCSIYGAAAPLPLRESFMTMHLSTPYQITKMLGELYANFFYNHYRLPVVKARLFNSYGPGEVPGQYRNVIPNFLFWALSGLPLPFTGTGDETRDFTYVADIVDGLLRAGYCEAAIGREMNIASGCETNILELARRINGLAGNGAGIVHAPPRAWDSKKRLLANIDCARSLLGYEPHTGLEGGLQNTIAWFRAHWDEIRRDAQFPPGSSAAVQGLVVRK
jgi:UDP-glucose 4-epimerase